MFVYFVIFQKKNCICFMVFEKKLSEIKNKYIKKNTYMYMNLW